MTASLRSPRLHPAGRRSTCRILRPGCRGIAPAQVGTHGGIATAPKTGRSRVTSPDRCAGDSSSQHQRHRPLWRSRMGVERRTNSCKRTAEDGRALLAPRSADRKLGAGRRLEMGRRFALQPRAQFPGNSVISASDSSPADKLLQRGLVVTAPAPAMARAAPRVRRRKVRSRIRLRPCGRNITRSGAHCLRVFDHWQICRGPPRSARRPGTRGAVSAEGF